MTCRTDITPRSPFEARIAHTQLSRSLGKTYRERWGLVLRTDRSSVILMQRILGVRFPSPAIRTTTEAADVVAHGALLSEFLVRRYAARWVATDGHDVANWTLATETGAAVKPFRRVLDFVLGRGGRDVVSLADELCATRAE